MIKKIAQQFKDAHNKFQQNFEKDLEQEILDFESLWSFTSPEPKSEQISRNLLCASFQQLHACINYV